MPPRQFSLFEPFPSADVLVPRQPVLRIVRACLKSPSPVVRFLAEVGA